MHNDRSSSLRVALALACALGAGCSTFNTARPLEPGQHAIAATFGGPILKAPGIGTVPMPHLTLEGRHGIAHHFDVGYGLHVLPLLFGVAGAHVGAAYQLNDQPDPWAPALTVSEKLYGFSNFPQLAVDAKADQALWGMSQTDLTTSWAVQAFGQEHLVYLGGTLYAVASTAADRGGRNVFLAPFAGVQIAPGVDWLRIQVEGRWLAPYLNEKFAVVDWIAPGDQGGVVVNAGVAVVLQ